MDNFGTQRQMEIYRRGADAACAVAPEVLEVAACARLEAGAYDYVAGGAGAEATLRANLAAFERWALVPRMLRDVGTRSLATRLLGEALPAPVLLAPVGLQGILHAEAECASAAAAAAVGLPYILSTLSSRSLEVVAATMERVRASAPRWFQLYWGRDNAVTQSLISRAQRAGYSALVVTLDTPMLGWRERDLGRAYLPFLQGDGLGNFFTDPVFCSGLAQAPEADIPAAVAHWAAIFSNPGLQWSDLAWLRRQTRLPIILKGILHPDDAQAARDAGVDGVIVSNHGGRQLDGSIAALDALPGVVERLQGQMPVLFDSGIRRGPDALKALALGASAVLLGRLYCWGLALDGTAGVTEVLTNFLADLDLACALAGLTSPAEAHRAPGLLRRA